VSNAVDATSVNGQVMRFASAVDLALLKLEAGAPKDLSDILSLIESRKLSEPEAPLLPQIASRADELSAWGKGKWAYLQRLLTPDEPQAG